MFSNILIVLAAILYIAAPILFFVILYYVIKAAVRDGIRESK
ncbi:hypothetical protein [Methanolapillus ohkumae]|uniref:Uncharacterized protein n=1 Tax=Methanolapillus ohkumae TaxID=3028298 RepID=A0AA96V864_9EURY|nr:hypothetical protein MsAm2_14140 [Methanosarcinaceae archaeon Am2]